MTEKRFIVHTLIEDYEVGEDDLKGHMIEILDNGNHMTYKECCDLLNELYEENQRFEQAFEKTMEDAFDRYMDSRIAEEVIDYIHISFYEFLKIGDFE